MIKPEENEFRQQLRKGMQQGEDELSPQVLQRLQQARSTAVAAATMRTGQRHYWGWAAGFASILFAVVFSWQLSTQFVNESMLEDMAMLAADEELELYQDLEFYGWLAESEPHG